MKVLLDVEQKCGTCSPTTTWGVKCFHKITRITWSSNQRPRRTHAVTKASNILGGVK